MASIFAHAVTGITVGSLLKTKTDRSKFFVLAIFCTVFPDADVIAFNFGIPYEHPLGHRGFTHSLAFAFAMAVLIKFLFYREKDLFAGNGILTVLVFFILMASHGFLDALTTGGRGIAFFWPIDNDRYFLPWRVIQVSPIGASNFRGEWALEVLKSEFLYVGIPSLLIYLIGLLFRRIERSSETDTKV